MSLVTWIKELFGTRWTDKEVVQYNGDTMDHGFYEGEEHIRQLRNRRPSLHQHQRLLVDAKIRELEAEVKLHRAREAEERRIKEEKKRVARAAEAESQRQANEAFSAKVREAQKPVSGNVMKPVKFDVDVDDAPTSKSDNTGWSTHTSSHSYTPSHSSSYSSHSSSHSHSCSSSHSSSSDSSSSSSSGGGGCD